MRNDLEHKIQRSIIQYSIRSAKEYPCFKMLYAIPNGAKRSAITALKLKNEGVKPGVWDLSMDYPSIGFHGLKIEVKAPKGRLSDAQQLMGYEWRCLGYGLMVVDSLDDFKKGINLYLNYSNKSPMNCLISSRYLIFSEGIKNG